MGSSNGIFNKLPNVIFKPNGSCSKGNAVFIHHSAQVINDLSSLFYF